MVVSKKIERLVSTYDPEKITIGVLGSHSAEEVGIAAKSLGLPSIVICEKGREDLYTKYNRGLFNHVLILDEFKDIVMQDTLEKLQELNTIFIPNRSFSVYVGYDNIENNFEVPLYGNRWILRAEERNEKKNQYWLLEKAGIKTPKKFNSPDTIDRLVIVKVQQLHRPLERAFFYASSAEEYEKKACELIRQNVIDEKGLRNARIEEYILGQKFNANFQGWALANTFDDFDFVGFDDRKQTNLHGFLGLPARDQLSFDVPIKNEEIGHYGLTMRESQKSKVYHAAEAFLRTCAKEFSPGIIGLFALQGAMGYDQDDSNQSKLVFYVFDVSPRIPGCPCVGPTSPEMRRLSLKYTDLLRELEYVKVETPMDLPIIEIKYAAKKDILREIVT